MRITINNLRGVAQVKFFKGEQVVHTETFNGKTTAPYTRYVGSLPAFDSRQASFVMGVQGEPEFTYSVHA
ncbi:hypothetical protein ACNFIC_02735 [Pseudomonas sp. NY15463]|uniref:hypothetical protein n=1 Tax=Pseudomonas sp. NY15463 TaxID=3400361 RepID=UPI003A8B946E